MGITEKELSPLQLPNPPQISTNPFQISFIQEDPTLIEIGDPRKINALFGNPVDTIVSQTESTSVFSERIAENCTPKPKPEIERWDCCPSPKKRQVRYSLFGKLANNMIDHEGEN